jgi:two-component system, NarL family, sensor histidine kinase UhpB
MKQTTVQIFFLSVLMLYSITAVAQKSWIDSVRRVAATQKPDTNKVWTLGAMSNYYAFNDPDSGILCAKQALALAEKLQFNKGIFWSIVSLNHSLYVSGNYTEELEYALKALPIAQKLNDRYAIGWSNGMICDSYLSLGDYHTAMKYIRVIMKNIEEYYPAELFSGYAAIVPVYIGLQKYDSALICAKKSIELLKADTLLYKGNSSESKYSRNQVYLFLGEAFEANAIYDSALFYYRRSIPISKELNTRIFLIDAYNGVAKSHKEKGAFDSAIWYAKNVLAERLSNTYPAGKLKATMLLSDIYEFQKNADSSLRYLRMTVNLKDSVFNREKTTAFQNSISKEKEKQKEIKAATAALSNRYVMYSSIALSIIMLIVAGIFIRNRRIKQLQNIRNSIADDLHDDIGSVLSSISIMNELAKERSPEALPLLASIGENTATIQENMSDIVWAIKAENDGFESVLQRMNQFASEILDAKNIELDFASDASLSTTRLTMEQRKNFYLLFKEIVNNAAKYSCAKKVTVSITRKDHMVEMNIKDDGNGFDETKVHNGNGMSSLKKRAAELKAQFKFDSKINEGSTMQLKFKIT